MVTIQQQIKAAETEVKKAREAETKRRREIAGAERKIRGIKVPRLSIGRQLSLAKSFGRRGVSRGAKQVAMSTKKFRAKQLRKIGTASSELKQFVSKIEAREKAIAKTKRQLAEIAAFNRDLKIARKAAARFSGGVSPRGLSKRQGRLFNQIAAGRALRKKAALRAGALRKVGLKPIRVRGKIVGFESIKRGQTIPVSSLGKLPSADIAILVKAGVLKFK